MLEKVALTEFFLCWILWALAFVKPKQQAAGQKEVASAPTSRWGIGLAMFGFALAWAYIHPVGYVKSPYVYIASMIIAPFSVALAWAATRHLGKQWRYRAAINADHELIQTGPYRWLRHPIYSSMFGMLLATLAAWTWWPLGIPAFVAFLIGTEIRVRTEERLLAEHFGAAFAAYRARGYAYLPFIR
jgi:protein-S-isoprenylcysteine O-methyltransferase Ste14